MSNDLKLLDMRFAKERLNYGHTTDLGDCFEIFSADLKLRDRRLSYDQIIGGLVGGDKDGGIDAFYLFVNGTLIQADTELQELSEGIKIELIFFQIKHEVKTDSSVMLKFIKHLNSFLSLDTSQKELDLLFSSDVQVCIKLFRATIEKYFDKSFEIFFEINYCSRATHPPVDTAVDLAKDVEKICTESLSNSKARFNFVGASELYRMSTQPISTKKTLICPAANLINSGDQNYVGLVTLKDFIEFITDGQNLDQNIFEFNVRDYEGNTKPVNKDIATTIQSYDQDADFWWFNNGITVIADEIHQRSGKLVISNPMIVNGLQTANVLYANKSSVFENSEDTRSLLVRLISISKQVIREGVIKATNSQTSLSPFALKATEKRHQKIEDYLKNNGIFYERRKNYYKNRNKASNKIIDVYKLGQSIMAINFQVPHQSRGRAGTYLNNPKNYDNVFPEQAGLEKFLTAAILERGVNDYIQKNRKSISPIHRQNLRFHSLMVLIWALAGKKTKNTNAMNVTSVSEQQIDKVFKWVSKEFDKATSKSSDKEKDVAAKNEGFTKILIANWNKNKTKI